MTRPDPVSGGFAPNLAPLFRRRLYDLPLRLDDLYAHPLGSASWCTRYGLHVNGPIPISLYFFFLSRMVVGSIEDLSR
jgi:hypothetical protein